MNEPTVEEIAAMAAQIHAAGQTVAKESVRQAIRIWDQSIKQLEERKQEKEQP